MSFAAEVKNELARLSDGPGCCTAAELAALLRMGGTILIGGPRSLGISFTSENAAVARKVLSLIKRGFQLKPEVVVTRGRRLKKNNSYHLKVPPSPAAAELLAVLGILSEGRLHVAPDQGVLRKACCRKAYLRGAFLACGSVNRPEGSYHLELVTGNYDTARGLVRQMKSFQLSAGLTDRKELYVVYLKDGDAITRFLQIIGAHNGLLTFENVRVVKEMRNQVNRLVNCETANLQKTVNAAVRQVESIRAIIDAAHGLQGLPRSLREVAEVRLAYPEATLTELAALMGGRPGKSGINHRLRKLTEIAAALPAKHQKDTEKDEGCKE
ncbi:MAG TPA: DNA-binding protein WhiA [Patescibacteria group bacterium]|nr:DNA-binding protein WhiA [Patescibacteria group bacterium]